MARPRRKRQPEIICIFGRRGSGKSTLAKKMIEEKPRVLVYDTLGEYKTDKVFTTPIELYLFLRDKKKAGEPFRIGYRPEDAVREFPWVCRIVENIGELTFVAEEVDFFISPSRLDPGFERLIRYGRHRGVELIAISRRPAEVNRNLTAQSSRLFIFKMHEPRDIAYFRSIIGPEAEKIPELPDFTPLEWAV